MRSSHDKLARRIAELRVVSRRGRLTPVVVAVTLVIAALGAAGDPLGLHW
jgi:hypothetical protein